MSPKKYLTFNLVEKKAKTNVYHVCEKRTGIILGRIYWDCPWRQYVLEPGAADIIWSQGCLQQIVDFFEELKKGRAKP